ncbi:MAG: phytase precursor [Bacteroidota bacterium]
MRHVLLLLQAVIVVGGLGCELSPESANGSAEPASTAASVTPVVLHEAFLTPRDTLDNVDSPAVWHGPDGEHWLLATAKYTDVLIAYDASTGEPQVRLGGSGSALGQMERPNGVMVLNDMAWVVERDNRRVQVFALPAFTSVGSFGADELLNPYGLTVFETTPGSYHVYVTDNYEQPDESTPPDSELGRRVRKYEVAITDAALSETLANTFGETAGAGVLRVVESIYADAPNDRLLIAEENEGESAVKVYGLDGAFTGDVIPSTFFPSQAEGLALYACGTDAGYWLTTDQSETANAFHVFDRMTLDHLGSFTGQVIRNTDGIALTQTPLPGFPTGAFYAVHDDGSVGAFGWTAIAEALNLRQDCVMP